MSILGIDFGKAKIGLAISVDGKISYSLLVIRSSRGKALRGHSLSEEAIEKIREICHEHEVKKIVIGLPLDQKGRLSKQAKKTKFFGKMLKQKLGIDLDYVNETLTSNEAVKKMLEATVPKSKRKGLEDAFSAQIILEDYLNEKQ